MMYLITTSYVPIPLYQVLAVFLQRPLCLEISNAHDRRIQMFPHHSIQRIPNHHMVSQQKAFSSSVCGVQPYTSALDFCRAHTLMTTPTSRPHHVKEIASIASSMTFNFEPKKDGCCFLLLLLHCTLHICCCCCLGRRRPEIWFPLQRAASRRFATLPMSHRTRTE